ncbi:MAG: hypothetical protein JW909_04290 [Planctomycetes bacterium]|nr:hypothetical protein [Planctomycetota bacterium]
MRKDAEMHYTPRVVSEHVPDFSSLGALLGHRRFQGKSGQELAIALWELIVDHDLGIYHYLPAIERFWNKDVYDPLKILNVYGFTICHCHAHMLAMIAREAGFTTRIANIRGHEGTEIFYDGAWHYFDADIQYFHRKHPPEEHIIASRQDLYDDPSLVDGQQNPSFPYGFPDRLPQNIRPLYEDVPSYLPVFAERIHSMDYRLRPGEEIVRFFHNKGRWVVFDYYPEAWLRYDRETGAEGPTERFWPRRQWGNGYFHYAPCLNSASRDVELSDIAMKGIEQDRDGLVCSGARGEAVLSFESPYIYCGVPDPLKRVPSERGALLKARFMLPEGTSATVTAVAGGRRRKLWSSNGRFGEVVCDADYTASVDGLYSCSLRFKLEGPGARLAEVDNTLWFMVSPHSLPALKNTGPNRMRLCHGDKHGLFTKPDLLEVKMEGAEGPPGAYSAENLVYRPETFSRVLPEDPSRPWRLTYRLRPPEKGAVAWVSAYAIFEGIRPGEDYDGTQAVIEVAVSPDGPWTEAARSHVYEHPQGWHFGLHGESLLEKPARTVYMRLSCKKGILGFRVAQHYVPAGARAASCPLEAVHEWYEVDTRVGRRLRSHVERVVSPEAEYVVECAQEPHDESITLRVPSVAK